MDKNSFILKIKDFNSVSNIPWQQLTPNEKHDWINQRDGVFDSLIMLGNNKDGKEDKEAKLREDEIEKIDTDVSSDSEKYNKNEKN